MVEGLIGGFTVLSLILLIAGFILIGIEFVMPGFSLPGILGTVCLIISVFITVDSFLEALIMILGILVAVGIIMAVMLWLFAKGKVASPLILKEEQNKDKGYISSSDLEYLLGKEGVTITDLRPTGIADFDGVSFDVVTSGQYISKNTSVVIYKVSGSKLIVKSK